MSERGGEAARIRVLIADDHAVLRAGIRAMIDAQSDMEAVGEAQDGAEAIERSASVRPDVVVLDLAMPGMGGMAALPGIRAACPDARILVLTMHDDEAYLEGVLRNGADGFLLKRAAGEDLLGAIRRVHHGDAFVDPSVTRTMIRGYLHPGDDAPALSEREREVLRFVAGGHTNREIADHLFLSVKTVESYRARIMEKLGLRTRAELVRYALRAGLLDANP